MSSIDERVVEMKFQNNAFESGVRKTLDTLSALKDGLKLTGATKGLDDVSSAASKFSLGNIGQNVDQIAGRFSAMSVAAIAALGAIGVKAAQIGSQLAQSLTVAPLKAGLQEYETNMNSIQTILANTSAKGTNLNDVNKALDVLNAYSDKTIYNFSQMARNIGTFTAAGVDLNTSTDAIKGIANLAAVSGSSADQASTAMYQLSQALASGSVKLMDWNSVVNAGMGGEVFQNALKETARNQGIAIDDLIKKNGSFRDSLQEGWLTTGVLTETLKKFTGDLNADQLKTMGYNDEQIVGILKMGQTAQDAATKIKTVSQLVSTLQETAGSGWAKSFQIVLGNFEEAKMLFTDVNNVLGGMVSASADARNKVLTEWKDLGGRTAVINGISNAFHALIDVLAPIKEAFRDVFPPLTGARLAELSKGFEEFTKKLKLGDETLSAIKAIFTGLFSAVDIVIQVFKGAAAGIGSFLSAIKPADTGILHFLSGIAQWITALDQSIKKGEGFKQFFVTIGATIGAAVKTLFDFVGTIKELIGGMSADEALGGFGGRLSERFAPLAALGGVIDTVWSRVMDILGQVMRVVGPFAAQVGEAFNQLGRAIVNSISTGDFNGVLDAINTGLFGGLVLILKKFMGNGINVDFGGGALGGLKTTLDQLTGTLKAMQTEIKADALLKIAAAIGILAISLVAIALIDSAKLTAAMITITVMFGQLTGALFALDKASSTFGAVKIGILAGSLILLAVAVDILAIAVLALSGLSWQELATGLTGVLVLLGGLVAVANLMPSSNAKMISTGIGMIAIAVAVKILASAVKDFSGMDWGAMAKGLVGVGAAMAAIALFTNLAQLDKVGLSSGARLILIGVALKVMASAVGDFAGMDWETLGRGFVGMAVALGLVTLALNLMPPNTLASAAALAVVAGSLLLIAAALQQMGGMTWEEIAKGLITLAGALTIIAIALNFMTTALPGAAAVLVVSAALAILTPVLMALGRMTWDEIGRGLFTLAAALAILGVAGLLITPVVPGLLGLGAAILLLGVGVAAIGVGVFLFAAGLTALSVAGAGAAVALTAIFSAIIALIPQALQAFGMGLVLLANIIANAGPQMSAAATTLITSILTAINDTAPKIIDTVVNLAYKLVRTLADNIPRFAQAGADMIVGLLNGISNNAGRVISAGADLIVSLLRGLQQNMGQVIQAGIETVISLVNGIANGIRANTGAMNSAGRDLASAIIEGMVSGISGGIGSVVSAARQMASSALEAAKSFLNINSPSRKFIELGKSTAEGMSVGIERYTGMVENSAELMGVSALNSMRKSISGIADLVGQNVDIRPTITPVLDLTGVQRDAKALGNILGVAPISATASYDGAATLANRYAAATASTGSDKVASTATPGTVSFTQINNSPKALSEAEIYRQTQNQLSTIKLGG